MPHKNPLYPVMSDAVTFKYEDARGRFAIASRDIIVGEVLTVEKAIVSHMLPEYMVNRRHLLLVSTLENNSYSGQELQPLFQVDEGPSSLQHLHQGISWNEEKN